MRRVVTIFLIALALIGLLWGLLYALSSPVSPPQAAGPYEVRVGESEAARPGRVDYARLDERIRRLMAEPVMVGLAIAVVEDGEIRFMRGYGRTAADGEESVTIDTVFRWASLSKGVAGDLIALLAQDGQLSLSDPAYRHAPSLRLPGGAEAMTTVEHVLTHQTGLFAHAQDSKLEDGMDPRHLRGSLATLHNICAPGTCHAYQNVAFDAASEMVERVTGQAYDEVLRERFFLPLGMNGASVGRAPLVGAASWARPHVGASPQRPVEVLEPYYRIPAAGGVNGSIRDLARWMTAQMGMAPDVLPVTVLALVQAPRVPTPRENFRRRRFAERTAASAYGLGWRAFDYAGHRVVGHHGGVRGYRSMILFDPLRRAGVVVLWNSSTPRPNAIEYEVMDMIYGLPMRDWLELDAPPESPPGAEVNGQVENEGS